MRSRLLGARRLRDRPPGRREVLHQRRARSTRRLRRGWRRPTTSTCRSPSTARPPRSTTPCAAPVRSRWLCARSRTCRRRASSDAKISVVVTRHNVDQLDDFKALADQLRRDAAHHAPASVGPRRRRVGRPAPHPRAAARALQLARRQRRRRSDRRLVLPSVRVRRRQCGGALPGLNLCGAGRVVCLIDPVGDVYACPFAIHEQLPRRKHPHRRWFPEVWQNSELFRELRRTADRRRVHQVQLTTTRAAAAAWRPSSSPACRWTVPTPNAFRATENRHSRSDRTVPQSSVDHSRTGKRAERRTPAAPVPLTLLAKPPAKILRRKPSRRHVDLEERSSRWPSSRG